MTVSHLPAPLVREAVANALKEDLGLAGDLTSDATIPVDAHARAVLNSRQYGVVAGMDLAAEAFASLDPSVSFVPLVADGERLKPGQDVARISGPARAVLMAERTALNFLCHLSGIATLTDEYAQAIVHTKARVACTRKTTPGLRLFEKHAVRCGGGVNHRYNLGDAILIKDNHIAICGGVAEAILAARSHAGHLVKIEVEVDTLDQLDVALKAAPDVVMLDNMTLDELREGVRRVGGRIPVEASGNVNLKTIADIAETGVDLISTSKITMSAPTLDLGLDIKIEKKG